MNSSWWLRPRARSAARARVVVAHHAGGAPSVFRPWLSLLPVDVDLCILALPGREARAQEPFASALAPVLDDAAAALGLLDDVPTVFFGHSLGALVAFELACRMRDAGRAPTGVVVAALSAPHLRGHTELHTLCDNELLEVLAAYGGIPEVVLQKRDLLALLLPRLRADCRLGETHSYVPVPPLACALVALGGVDDRIAPPADVVAWNSFTTGSFATRSLPGGHFFVAAARTTVVADVLALLPPPLAEKAT